MRILILTLTIFISGCANNQYYVGASIHASGQSGHEINMKNPICVAGVEYQLTENIKAFSEHHSMCFYEETEGGFNQVGAKYYF